MVADSGMGVMAEQRKRMTYEQQRAKREAAKGNKAKSPEQAARKVPPLVVVAAVVLLALLVFALRTCSAAMTIDVTVNGLPYTLRGAKTLQTAVKESGLPINPGDLISIRGTVLERGAGDPIAATVNDRETIDLNQPLHNNDVVTITDGKDIVEEYDTEQEVSGHSARISGAGAVHQITPGQDGITEVRTGKLSGEVVRKLVQDSTDAICLKSNPEVGDDKVLALTFEEGPSREYTGEILDILSENDARATFFCVGNEVDKYNDDLVQRERDEGHQVCIGTYNAERTTGGNAKSDAKLDLDDLRYQVEHGLEAISNALDGEGFSTIVRLPGNNIKEDMVQIVDSHVTADIGWNVDTGDWMESPADRVQDVLMTLEPGDIVRLHDGGGDHSGTVEALREALPKLKEAGYSFVTIDDLLKYPPQT